jgi:DNA ligase D-like protein (predicted 3'-phosphoesterase)
MIGVGEAPLRNYLALLLPLDDRLVVDVRKGKGVFELSRFVVQKHHATRLHYDFRLEMGGVLKSWAVPKGPPTEPGIRRLAVQVDDHPVSYIDFQGDIAEGLYGAGKVEIWDKGEYELQQREPDLLTFTLDGDKLQGEYALVHTGAENWLLLKRKQP